MRSARRLSGLIHSRRTTMNNNLVHSTIRRSNRNQLILCAVGALLLVGLAAFNTRYFYNFFFGPFPADRQALLATTDAGALRQYFVKLSGDRALDSIGQEVSRSRSGSENVTATYMVISLDDRLLLVKAQDDAKITDYTGYLEPMPSDVSTEILGDIERDAPDVRDAFLPYLLNTDSFRGTGYV